MSATAAPQCFAAIHEPVFYCRVYSCWMREAACIQRAKESRYSIAYDSTGFYRIADPICARCERAPLIAERHSVTLPTYEPGRMKICR